MGRRRITMVSKYDENDDDEDDADNDGDDNGDVDVEADGDGDGDGKFSSTVHITESFYLLYLLNIHSFYSLKSRQIDTSATAQFHSSF